MDSKLAIEDACELIETDTVVGSVDENENNCILEISKVGEEVVGNNTMENAEKITVKHAEKNINDIVIEEIASQNEEKVVVKKMEQNTENNVAKRNIITVENENDILNTEQDAEQKSIKADVVKSSTVVKSSVLKDPIKFGLLECDSDIHVVPSGWASTIEGQFGLEQASYQTKGFTSYRLASQFPECLANVDIVSNSENIKRILKLPELPETVISMVVHKIGETYLLDELDTDNYLLSNDKNWKLFRLAILGNGCFKDLVSMTENRQNLLPEFIYKSIFPYEHAEDPEDDDLYDDHDLGSRPLFANVFPEPKLEDTIPDFSYSHQFNQSAVWTFGEVKFLVGSNMHIFEGLNRPRVNLRLNEISLPFQDTTGKDYWLDNLMFDIPDVVICHHLQGIVQNYQLIKTEDLPNLKNSEFSPSMAENVTKRILLGLKQLATDAAHTYWLFKAKDDYNIGIYDLTALCKPTKDRRVEICSPFNVSNAMLQYTIAKTIVNNTYALAPRQAKIVQDLLRNCIKSLPTSQYPEILTSAHYLLTELYIPHIVEAVVPLADDSSNEYDSQIANVANIDLNTFHSNPNGLCFNINLPKNETLNNDHNKMNQNIPIATANIVSEVNMNNNCDPTVDQQQQLNLLLTPEERCRYTFCSIFDGLNCLKNLTSRDSRAILKSERDAKEDEKLTILRERLHYDNLKVEDPNFEIPTLDTKMWYIEELNTTIFGSWRKHMKLLFVQKAYLAYRTQAELDFKSEEYGYALKGFYNAFRCHQVVLSQIESIDTKNSYLFGRAADCFFAHIKYAKHAEKYLKQYYSSRIADDTILNAIRDDLSNIPGIEEVTIDPTTSLELTMGVANCLYECALNFANPKEKIGLMHRSAVASNEFSLKLMFLAQDEYERYMSTYSQAEEESKQTKENYEHVATKSYNLLLKSFNYFKETNDTFNQGLISSNMGNYMMFRGNIHFKGEAPGHINHFQKFYGEAIICYKRAMAFLVSRERHISLWDSISWDLSTATFQLFQKNFEDESNGDMLDQDLHKQCLELLYPLLSQLCNSSEEDNERVEFNYLQKGIIHKRIGMLHFAKVRSRMESVVNLKRHHQLCRVHFEKAYSCFDIIHAGPQLLSVQIKRIIVQEYLAHSTKNKSILLKNLKLCLTLFLETKSIFALINKREKLTKESLILLRNIIRFEVRLQFTLKCLSKLTLTEKFKNEAHSECYKKMYFHTLNASKFTDEVLYAKYIYDLLEKIDHIHKELA